MNTGIGEMLDSQLWISDRWVKHRDSKSIVRQFSKRSSWYPLSVNDDGLDAASMSSLAAAFANEGNEAWLDSTRLAWRMAAAQEDLRTLATLCGMLSQLGQDPFSTPELHHFRKSNYVLGCALCSASNWVVGHHVVNSGWAKVLRNSGNLKDFMRVAGQLDSPSVLRSILSGEATAVQRFSVVQTLALFELEKTANHSRLDWILGLLSELGSDVESGSTAMRVLLVETEQAIKINDYYRSYVGMLQLVQHMTAANSELCGRADLACMLRLFAQTFASENDSELAEIATAELVRKIPNSAEQIESLARDIDRINRSLPAGLSAKLPRLARRNNAGSRKTGVVLAFDPKD